MSDSKMLTKNDLRNVEKLLRVVVMLLVVIIVLLIALWRQGDGTGQMLVRIQENANER